MKLPSPLHHVSRSLKPLSTMLHTNSSLLSKLAYMCVAFFMLFSTVAQADLKDDRAAAAKLYKDGNWKDAYALRVKNLKQQSDAESARDLEQAVGCSRRLSEYNNIDELLKLVNEKHSDNWKVLMEAGEMMSRTTTYGALIDSKFQRGAGWNQGGERVNSLDRDRVMALNFYWQAYEKAPQEQKFKALDEFQDYLIDNNYRYSFYELTDLNVTPVLDTGNGHHYRGSRSRVPVADDGSALFIAKPETYEASKNDGERWRWAISEMRRLSGNQDYEKMTWAHFMKSMYGVETLSSFSWWRNYTPQNNKEDQEGIMQVHTLKDDETLCRVATGVKRIKLKDEYNFIKMYRDLYEQKNNSVAGDNLVNIYLDRMQFKKAAVLAADIIEKHGEGYNQIRKEKYEQIVADWGSFLNESNNFLVDGEIDFTIKFRNAKAVEISLFEVDFEGVTDAVWAHWKSTKKNLDYNRRAWGSDFTTSLLSGRFNGFIGDKLHTEKFDLLPNKEHVDTLAHLSVPAQKKAGCYLLKGVVGEGEEQKSFYKIIWVDGIRVASTNVHNGTLYYVTDAKTGKPLNQASIHLRGYHQEYLNHKNASGRRYTIHTKEKSYKTNAQGCVVISNESHKNYSWMLTAKHGESLGWMDQQYMGSHHDWRHIANSRAIFAITSQPVYRPASKVEGKAWVRATDYANKEEVSNFANRSMSISFLDPIGEKFGKPISVTADKFGGVHYSIEVPADARLGTYRVHVDNRYAGTFRVEKYKKPEFEVSVDAPSEPVLLGDEITATVTAKYYHGAPVRDAKVKVKILRHSHNARWFPSLRWDWLYGNGYGWLDIERSWSPWNARWGCKCPYPFWYRNNERPELVSEQLLELQGDGTAKVAIDTSIAKLIHSDKDHRYEISAEVTDASRRTIFAKGSVIAARKPFKVTTWLDKGYAKTGEMIEVNTTARTLAGKIVKGEGNFILKRVMLGSDGEFEEEELKRWKLQQADEGFEKHAFSCEKQGQYSILAEVTDAKGRKITGGVLFEVRGPEGKAAGVAYNNLELIVDNREYSSDDVVKLAVNTKAKQAHVLLFIRHTKEMKIIKIDDHSATVEIPLNRKDIPNISVQAMTVSNGIVYSEMREIIIPPVEKILNVEVVADEKKYKPQDKGSVKVRVTDDEGKPVEGSAVIAIYDKSLEYISGGSNVGEIKPFFWKKRHLQRRYWKSSILGFGSSAVKLKHLFMKPLGRFGYSLPRSPSLGRGVMFKGEASFGRKSDGFKANGLADSVMTESEGVFKLAASKGNADKSKVAVAEVDIQVRKDFADLAKWVGALNLDENGEAVVPIEFPDNLTTWKIKTWAMSHGTRVGEGSTEVITSKDLLIRLQAPRFFVEKDEVTLSAIVHNYHDTAQEAKVSIELEGDHLELLTENEKEIHLDKKNGEQRVDWTVKVSGEGEAIVRMKALTQNDGDIMEMKFPVYVHGIQKQTAFSGSAAGDDQAINFEVDVPEQRKPELSRLELRYSPSLAMAIVDALPYLVDYPHGCTEQTLNRFVPTVVTQKLLKDMGVNLEDVKNKRTNLNAQELGDDKQRSKRWKRWQRNPVFDHQEVDKMVKAGVRKLTNMQLSDGGWGWFSGSGERSYPHTTCVVLHGLVLAKKNGAEIPQTVIDRGINWLKNYETRQLNEILTYRKTKGEKGKSSPEHRDVLVRLTLAENNISNKEMLDEIYKVKNNQSVYVKCMLAMSLHLAKDQQRFTAVMKNIEQFLEHDKENQTSYLKLRNSGYWWYWYGNEIETHAIYLRLLTINEAKSEKTRRVVKYLLNNRKNGSYWNSTRDTAYCIEAIAGFVKASKEDKPNFVLEVLVDGELKKQIEINSDNLFTFDNKLVLTGEEVTSGKHKIELRKKGKGSLYANAYLSVFTKEDHIKKTGAEVKVERRYYKLVRQDAKAKVKNDKGRVVTQQADKFQRIPLQERDLLKSGDRVEVELILESKNNYEYLMISDWKAAGMEAEKVRSGYTSSGGFYAYMEVHDERISYFVKNLAKGRHSIKYKLRAEIPGEFSALPAQIEAMYAPELKANSDEMKIRVED